MSVPPSLPPDEVVRRLQDDASVTLVDVRTPAEHAQGHVEGAVLIDWYGPSCEQRLAELPRDGAYLLYCRSGNRSGRAASMMATLGFQRVWNAGGFQDLAAAGAPVAR